MSKLTTDEACRREAERILAAKCEAASAKDSEMQDDELTRMDEERREAPQPISEDGKQKLIQSIAFEEHFRGEDKNTTPTKSEAKKSEAATKAIGKATSSSSMSVATPTGAMRVVLQAQR